ncbi:MAG: hypothetical protein HZA18_06325 [Nitrospirae bacterium]|nr:hypothetical protein [Nitrospirota bacterium]
MKILLLITSSGEIISEFQAGLTDEYIVLPVDSLEKGADLLRTARISMIAVDVAISENVGVWIKGHKAIPDLLWIGIVPSNLSGVELDRYHEMFHEMISAPLSKERLNAVIRKSQERQDMLSELEHFRLQSVPSPERYSGRGEGPLLAFEPLEKAVALSRTFAASFDLDKLINLFLEAVMEVIGVGRISLFLFDEAAGVYKIKGSRGLRPDLASRFSLSCDSGMVLWLSAKGRVLRRDRAETDAGQKTVFTRALREMEVLQAIVSIPIMSDGRLLCLLNLDSKITGDAYSNTEIERLFVLSNYFGRAIQDIYNYHRVCYQKEYIQKILERMGSGVITVNDREEVMIFNPKAEEILNRKASDLIGRGAAFLPPAIAALIRETVRERKVYRRHEMASEAEGLYLAVDTYGLYDVAGGLIGGVVLLDDISARKELSRERKKGESLQVLNELVGRMAHELRNPLVAVRTFTQLMKDRYNDKDFQEFFYTTVTGEVEKLNNLIEKLIAFVHPIEYKFETVDMGDLIDKTLESILKDQKASDLRLVKNYAPGIFKLSADKAQLSKALSYILQNSLIAMNSGGTLTVDVESLLKDAMIRVSIKDTGKGIPQEDIERAFDPFYTTPEKGIGLGLPLSQKIIEDHKGKVTIESAPNQGTTLTVLLPVAAPTREGV